jgi:hypothetical protein
MNNGNLYVQAYYQGGMTGFEVLCSDDIYQVARDGRVIATLSMIPNGISYPAIRCPMM